MGKTDSFFEDIVGHYFTAASLNSFLMLVVVKKLRLEYDIVTLRATRDIVDVVNIARGSTNRFVSLDKVSMPRVCLYQRIKVVVASA